MAGVHKVSIESDMMSEISVPQARTGSVPVTSDKLPEGHKGSTSSLFTRSPGSRTRRNTLGTVPKRYPRSTNVEWHNKWQRPDWKNGRVLLIDYINPGGDSKTKIMAQEFHDLRQLERFYASRKRTEQAALRVIHVQNSSWANYFLLKKFNIDHRNDLVGTDFGKWARFDRPEWRAGKPLLRGRTWRTQRDPWRGINRTAFGLDYLKHYEAPDQSRLGDMAEDEMQDKMMELTTYDDSDGPAYGFDVFVQRMSVYIQHNDGSPRLSPDDVKSPYVELEYSNDHRRRRGDTGANAKRKLPPLESMDNGSTIIIFEHSQFNSVEDTLIGARQQIESRWRRLAFYLPKEDMQTDARLALQCTNFILEDIFKGLSVNWDEFLNVAETHVSILENKIYESPADESRAPELWTNSALWLKVEKLMFIHNDIVKEMVTHLGNLAGSEDDTEWLSSTVEEYEKLVNMVQEDLVKPTANLSDLMYKSVGIRDSRHSLQLGTSMWRLSWITFIFLPLTFTVGFFGMNVDTFQRYPDIKWYFVTAVPLMITILCAWYMTKHVIAANRQTPYQRGVYDHLFYDLAVKYPKLWSRGGPRANIQPIGAFSTLKWRLLCDWFDPRKTINRKPKGADGDEDAAGSGLSNWARIKRSLARRWLSEIRIRLVSSSGAAASAPGVEAGDPGHVDEDGGAVLNVLRYTTPVAMVEGEPTTHPITKANLNKLSPPRERSMSPGTSDRPSSSGRSSGIMVEERDANDEEENQQDTAIDWSIDRMTHGVGFN